MAHESAKHDFDLNAPNPVNLHPHGNSDYPKPKATTSKIEAMPSSASHSVASPAISRPPKNPGPALGPYYHFIGTDLTQMRWLGSALIFRHVSFARPKIEFSSAVKIEHRWEVLFENLFDMRAYRVDLSIELRPGQGDDEIGWKIDWGDSQTEGMFRIARYDQKWRGGFFSCNGFDATVSEQKKSELIFGNVWEHLNSVHAETPLHLLLWGGDQTYIDFIFEDIPYLREWVEMEWNQKWTCDFRDDLKEQIEQYHFNTYVENWERSEVKNALASIPSLMMWDDHDIFDGAGSYPTLLHDSPMMSGLFSTAQKMRLLFQHHTTVEKARDHGLFGYQAHNFLTFCGPNLAIVGADGRTERSAEVVQDARSWDMIFDKLEKDIVRVPHLIVLFPVPFSFLRFKLAESIFEQMKKFSARCRRVELVKHSNSIFGLPELYDDLLDEWTHEAHIDERNRALERFQALAGKKKIRVTFFSGDVHCCGISRFKTHGKTDIAPVHDEKLMYQVISSAIVNLPPPKTAIRLAHYFTTKWRPIEHTDEELINFFQDVPETGGKLFHQKLLSNRNWCYFEQCDDSDPSMYATVKTGFFHRHLGGKDNSTTATDRPPGSSSIEENSTELEPTGKHHLRVRLWLESSKGYRAGRAFAKYDLVIPSLM